MKLMQNSGVPLYQQIADSFKTDILAGRYEPGAVSYTHLDVYKRQSPIRRRSSRCSF